MKNKTLYSIILGFTFLVLVNSCQDGLLEETPKTFLSSTNLYKTSNDAKIVLTGVYSHMRAYRFFDQNGLGFFWGDMGVDIELMPPWGWGNIGNYTSAPSWSYIRDVWQAIYETAYRANVAIGRIGAMDETLFEDVDYGDGAINERDVIVAEAHFMRALVYFYGVMIYGNMPLIVDETTDLNSFPTQSLPLDIYEQVIADLEIAESTLPWKRLSGEEGRATKGAAKALLGKAYLQMTGFPLYQTDKYEMAAGKFKEVIDAGVYELLDRYGDVFDPLNEEHNEFIFVVKNNVEIGQTTGTGSYQGIIGDVSNGGGYENTFVNTDFLASFDSSDVRFWWNMSIRDVNGKLPRAGQCYPWKYHTPPGMWQSGSKGFDWPILRYSDVLLMYAEALNGANTTPPVEAYQAINSVRARARLDQDDTESTNSPTWLNDLIAERLTDHPTDADVLPDLQGLSKEEFLTALLDEQAKELCWEGQRKAMLIRTGKLKEYITEPHYTPQNFAYYPGLKFQENRNLWWAIPTRELDINPNLVQNPNYD